MPLVFRTDNETSHRIEPAASSPATPHHRGSAARKNGQQNWETISATPEEEEDPFGAGLE